MSKAPKEPYNSFNKYQSVTQMKESNLVFVALKQSIVTSQSKILQKGRQVHRDTVASQGGKAIVWAFRL